LTNFDPCPDAEHVVDLSGPPPWTSTSGCPEMQQDNILHHRVEQLGLIMALRRIVTTVLPWNR
jgi:hypothetical protein